MALLFKQDFCNMGTIFPKCLSALSYLLKGQNIPIF